ncbi:ABC transporter ATP-binding protein [Amycolatopsis acidicola]|uniref:ABC transporter ATP-binding protein n=1 Tax=Amycolatopsis acidicola TaxID=2596893 RepID=A0A5N0UQD9_9PSEU|nr:ABC transporter ATP-binding protein [Amycolatopsis acidicola]KAA9153451.1 ABC transporter ATP-binding protein [Amycolatopsis acidicola]
MTVLEIEDLTVGFRAGAGWNQVVSGLSMTVGRGETVALVGESGSGKTVTSMAVMRLLPANRARVTGQVRFDGRDLLTLRRRELDKVRGGPLSMVFQEPMTSLNPAFTVGEQIAEAVRRHRGLNRREARRAAVEAMDAVGIAHAGRRAGAYPHEFSGGMRQRVMIAMAIGCRPRLLIADEPTTALDVTIQAQILDLLRELRSGNGMAMIFVTHDLGVVAEIADTVAVMYAGRIVERAPVAELFARPRHPYTAGLLRSVPSGAKGGLYSIPGSPPRPGEFPPGCRFEPRCGFAEPGCAGALPVLETLGGSHAAACSRAAGLDLRPEGAAHV